MKVEHGGLRSRHVRDVPKWSRAGESGKRSLCVPQVITVVHFTAASGTWNRERKIV